MCGRFTSKRQIEELAELYNGRIVNEDYWPSFNVAPSDRVSIVAGDNINKQRLIGLAQFGMMTTIKDKTFPLVNLRSEKAASRADLANRRCVVPADGFFEWQVINSKEKQPCRLPVTNRFRQACT